MVNCLAKIFTQLICDRLVKWASERNLIPESQSGFRKGRSCLDNLFSLMSIIQIHLSKEKTVVYAAFIDFKGAFPSVSHHLLWKKLSNLGVSTKIIKILEQFYSNAFTCIKTEAGCTEYVKITKGVLQDEVLSPLLFLLFIFDFEKIFIGNQCKGLSINNEEENLMLGYADDYVIFADSPIELNKKLSTLFSYCEKNDLTVNVEKTKIVIFTRSGNASVKKFKTFNYGSEKIEVAREYTYLGVVFNDSGSFLPAALRAISAANLAIGNIMKIIHTLGMNSWRSYDTLFQSLSLSTLFYGVQSWGLRHLDLLEKVKLSFFKKLLSLPINTPNYVVRLETGSLHLSYRVFSLTLNWISKISTMDHSRYPRLCFEKLKELARKRPVLGKLLFKQLRYLYKKVTRYFSNLSYFFKLL